MPGGTTAAAFVGLFLQGLTVPLAARSVTSQSQDKSHVQIKAHPLKALKDAI